MPFYQQMSRIKKPPSVLTTFAPMTEATKKGEVILEKILCTHYSFYFQKNTEDIKALINSGTEVNAITLV